MKLSKLIAKYLTQIEASPRSVEQLLSAARWTPGTTTKSELPGLSEKEREFVYGKFLKPTFKTDMALALQDIFPKNITDTERRLLLSHLAIDPMGYRAGQHGAYGWGELAAMYQTTPATSIALRVQQLRREGRELEAGLTERLYGHTQRVAEPKTEQTEERNYPLWAGNYSAIRTYYPQIQTGQRDVMLDPGLVARLTTERPMERAQKRRYKGGTRVAGALSTVELGKRKLGE